MKRREFITKSLTGSAAIMATGTLISSKSHNGSTIASPKISLAQWSLHRTLEKGEIHAEDFVSIAFEKYQIGAVEYVNAFYRNFAKDQKFWNNMKKRADDIGVNSLLIMVDNEGDLGDTDDKRRKEAVENHYKWLEAAKILECHSIRVNAFGKGDRSILRSALVDGLGSLAEYGAQLQLNVLIENHGLHTSDADFITGIIRQVDNKFLGTLPDFGNWCLNKEWGSTQGGQCTEMYDPYMGVEKMLPFAKGVSAKSYEFNQEGYETSIDYQKMFQLVKKSDFEGYIGIEYEGQGLSEDEGIKATKSLIEKAWREA